MAALVSMRDAAVEEAAVLARVCQAPASFAGEDGRQRTDQAAWDRWAKLGLAAPDTEKSPGAQPALLT